MSSREDIKAYLDGELDQASSIAVRDALERDPELRNEAEFYTQIHDSIRRYVRQPAVEEVGSAFVPSRPRLRALHRWLPWSAAIAACLLFVSLAGPPILGGRAIVQDAPNRSADAVAPSPPASEIAVSDTGSLALEATSEGGHAVTAESTAITGRDTALASSLARHVVHHATLQLRVVDARSAMDSAASLAMTYGGFVESRQYHHSPETPSAHMVLRVPQARYEAVLEKLRQSLGVVVSESTTTEDVTVQVVDVEAKLRALRAEEQQYIAMLRGARTIGEVLSVREQMNQVRRDIESLEARQKVLRSLTSLSTISLTFEQRPSTDDPKWTYYWAQDAWNQAFLALANIFRVLGIVAIYIFVLSPIWLPALGLAWWLRRRL